MPERRIRRMQIRPGAILIVALSLAVMSGALLTQPSAFGQRDGTPEGEATPLSQATADEVTIALLSASALGEDFFVVEIRAHNGGTLPVGIERELIALEVQTTDGKEEKRALDRSNPPLPCAIAPGKAVHFALTFAVETGEAPTAISVGIAEQQRSGATVVLPFAPGAGASAIGGNGMPGASAIGTAVAISPESPIPADSGATPGAEGCNS